MMVVCLLCLPLSSSETLIILLLDQANETDTPDPTKCSILRFDYPFTPPPPPSPISVSCLICRRVLSSSFPRHRVAK